MNLGKSQGKFQGSEKASGSKKKICDRSRYLEFTSTLIKSLLLSCKVSSGISLRVEPKTYWGKMKYETRLELKNYHNFLNFRRGCEEFLLLKKCSFLIGVKISQNICITSKKYDIRNWKVCSNNFLWLIYYLPFEEWRIGESITLSEICLDLSESVFIDENIGPINKFSGSRLRNRIYWHLRFANYGSSDFEGIIYGGRYHDWFES